MKNKVIYIDSRTTVLGLYALARKIADRQRPLNMTNNLLLAAALTNLDKLLEQYGLSINYITAKSHLKVKLKQLDEANHAIFYQVRAYCCSADPEVKQAAVRIQEVIEEFGLDIIRKASNEAWAKTNSMTRELSDPTHTNDIAILPNLAENITHLQNTLLDFEQSRISYNNAKAKERAIPAAYKQKDELYRVLNHHVLENLSAAKEYFPDDFENYARKIEESVSEHNDLVKRHNTILENKEEPTEYITETSTE